MIHGLNHAFPKIEDWESKSSHWFHSFIFWHLARNQTYQQDQKVVISWIWVDRVNLRIAGMAWFVLDHLLMWSVSGVPVKRFLLFDFLFFFMSYDWLTQMFISVKIPPERFVRSSFLGLELSFWCQRSNTFAKHLLKALRYMTLVVNVILNTNHTVATNSALCLNARAELV